MEDKKVDSKTLLYKLAFGLLAVISMVAVILGFATLFSRHLFFAELVNSFRLQLALLILFLSVLLYYAGFRIWSFSQFLFGLVIIFPIASSFVPLDQAEPGTRKISLLSYNVLGKNTDHQSILDMINDNGADVLVVLEYQDSWIAPLEKLAGSYPYSVKEPRQHGFGIALFSRFPIIESKVHLVPESVTEFPFIVAEIKIQDQTFFIAAGHFLAPLTPQKMRIRNDQINEVADIIRRVRDDNESPVILVGDFNCVSWSPNAKDLRSKTKLRDSRQGYLYHGSWPTDNPLACIPIDNAYVSEQIHIHDRRILNANSSDHFPLYLEFSFADQLE